MNASISWLIGTTCLLAACVGPQTATVSVAPNVGASGGALLPEQAAIDVQHYLLELNVDPDARTIDGSLTMTAEVLHDMDRVVLHLDEHLSVESVEVGAIPVEFEHAQGLISASLPVVLRAGELLQVRVAYGGAPRVAPNPPWDGGFTWSTTADGSPWIATSCQGEGADLWWPCKDHPSDEPETMDLHITVPGDLVVASNGVLKWVDPHEDGTRTWHWHVASPINNYGVALNIAPYELVRAKFESVDGSSFPVVFYVLPENLEQGEAFMPEILDHLRFYEDLLGPYPFRAEKYGVVETPHLGMEHQTIIAYGNRFRPGDPDYDWLHHHELSHEWWANLVTCRDWKDMWLHEGFGTYMQALYLEQRFGPTAYRDQMASTHRLNNARPVAPRESHDSKQIYFTAAGGYDSDIYNKGSWVLHTLRWQLGDEVFMTVLRRMAYPDPALEKVTDGSQTRFVDTEDFRSLAEDISGRDLAGFFEVYLRQPELPVLVGERTDDGLYLSWSLPLDVSFALDVPVSIDGRVQRVLMTDEGARIPLRADQSVEIDPEARLLKGPDQVARLSPRESTSPD
jgi:aminopeptidase N